MPDNFYLLASGPRAFKPSGGDGPCAEEARLRGSVQAEGFHRHVEEEDAGQGKRGWSSRGVLTEP